VSNLDRIKIESALQECSSHVHKIERSQKLLKEFFPLAEKSLTDFTEDNIEHIDQFIYRFTKLQDALGLRLIPSIYNFIENDNTPKPFLDILNRLEKLQIIPDVEEWQMFRNLRNNLAHDYPGSARQTAETLNLLYGEIHKMISIYKTISNYYYHLINLQ